MQNKQAERNQEQFIYSFKSQSNERKYEEKIFFILPCTCGALSWWPQLGCSFMTAVWLFVGTDWAWGNSLLGTAGKVCRVSDWGVRWAEHPLWGVGWTSLLTWNSWCWRAVQGASVPRDPSLGWVWCIPELNVNLVRHRGITSPPATSCDLPFPDLCSILRIGAVERNVILSCSA